MEIGSLSLRFSDKLVCLNIKVKLDYSKENFEHSSISIILLKN